MAAVRQGAFISREIIKIRGRPLENDTGSVDSVMER